MSISWIFLTLFVSRTIAQPIYGEHNGVNSIFGTLTSAYGPHVTPTPYNGPGRPPAYQNQTEQSGSIPNSSETCYYWLEETSHHGKAPFQPDSSYAVFRNVKDYGAKGDGVTDDTNAINLAISNGGRCAPGSCNSTTTTPAIVYFPAGTYVIGSPIIDYYYTQLIGNPNCLPTLQASPNFTGFALIDADPYTSSGLAYGSTNTFYRQTRNFIFDLTKVPFNNSATGIHWPTGQATSLQNLVFLMSDANGTQHQGVFMEEGSGGLMVDLVFYGGLYGVNWGNQQFTMRNLSFYNSVTAINQLWDWGWTYKGISINNCSIGINMSSIGPTGQTVGSITLFDSSITNTPIGILTAHDSTSQPPTGGSLIIENVQLNNVSVAVNGPTGVALAGTTGSTTIAAWGQGHAYTPDGPNAFQNNIAPNSRPPSLLDGDSFYQRSKPQYETYQATSILSARSIGANGDGVTDDSVCLQAAIWTAHFSKQMLFLDAGVYRVTSTIYIPAGSTIVGEAYPVILGSGPYFSNVNDPKPVVQIGYPGERGTVEWSDTIVSTEGATAGAIYIEWNLDSSSGSTSSYHSNPRRRNQQPPSHPPPRWSSTPSWPQPPPPSNPFTWPQSPPPNPFTWPPPQPPPPQPQNPPSSPPQIQQNLTPSGLWDIHTRAGGFANSSLSYSQCPSTSPINTNCAAGFLSLHITPTASTLYIENVWLWTADHDLDDPQQRQISIYTGRGLYLDAPHGPIWTSALASEHHALYQYQLSNIGAEGVYMTQLQSETAYWQPQPMAEGEEINGTWNDPGFSGLGLRVLMPASASASGRILLYGVNLYSFYNDYNTSCSAVGAGEDCQGEIFSIEGPGPSVADGNGSGSGSGNNDPYSGPISIYNLNTVGSTSMIDLNGQSVAEYSDNVNTFPDTVALFRL